MKLRVLAPAYFLISFAWALALAKPQRVEVGDVVFLGHGTQFDNGDFGHFLAIALVLTLPAASAAVGYAAGSWHALWLAPLTFLAAVTFDLLSNSGIVARGGYEPVALAPFALGAVPVAIALIALGVAVRRFTRARAARLRGRPT